MIGQSLPMTRVASTLSLLLVIFLIIVLFVNLVLYGVFSTPQLGLFLVLALFVFAAGVFIAMFGFSQAPRRRWLILFCIPLCIGSVMWMPQLFIGHPQHWIDSARFYAIRKEYQGKVDSVERKDAPRFIKFKWEGIDQTDMLVFDESGELGRPNQPKPEDWWLRAGKGSDFRTCKWNANSVAEHFYVVRFYCP